MPDDETPTPGETAGAGDPEPVDAEPVDAGLPPPPPDGDADGAVLRDGVQEDDEEQGSPRWALIGAAAAVVLVLFLTVLIVRTRSEDALAGPVEVAPPTTRPATTAPPDTEVAETTTTEEPTTTTTTAAPTTSRPTTTRVVAPPPTTAKPGPDLSLGVPRPSQVAQGAVPHVEVFDAPAGRAKYVLDNPKLINGDPNARVPLILPVKQMAGSWIEVWTPVRPNGSTGWVRSSDVTVSSHDYLIEVHLNRFSLRVWQGDELLMDTTIAVASNNSPTPGGLYYTTELIAPPGGGGGPYGPYAYGLSGFSNTYTTFGGGPGQLGLHGTNEPGSIGRAVSHGCIRLRNDDISRLAGMLPLGVPVLVYS